MFNNISCIRIFVFILLFPAIFKCSEPLLNLRFKHLSKENGLSSSQTNAIVMDSKGYIWIATRNGLNRFDGTTIKTYLHDKNNPYSISDNVTYKLLIDYKGRLLVSTRAGLNLYDHLKDRFITIKTKNGKEIYTNALVNIRNNVVVASTNSIFKIDWRDTTCVLLSELYANKNINLTAISYLFYDNLDRLWICSWQNGLSIYNFGEKSWKQIEKFTNNSGQTACSVHEVIADRQNNFWITTAAGLFRYSSDLHLIKSYEHESSNVNSLSYTDCSTMLYDKEERLWIGTSQGGLNLYDPAKDNFIRYFHQPDNGYSLDDNSIQDIYEDNNNILWAGTNKGVNYFHKDMFLFHSISNVAGTKNSLSHNIVTSFQEDSKGNLWIGTDGGGLNYWDRKRNQFTVYQNQINNNNSVKSNSIFTLCEDQAGRLWIGGYQNGFSVFDPHTNSFKHFNDNNTNEVSLVNNDVRDIIKTSDGHIWIATNGGGLLELLVDKEKIINKYIANPGDSLYSLANNYCLTLYEDKNNNLWIGTYSGLSKLDLHTRKIRSFYTTDNKSKLSDDWIYSICEDSNGNLWFGTTKGLNLYNPLLNTFTTFDKKHGLPGNLINGIVEDPDGYLWISTDMGLCKFDPKKHDAKTYSTDYGLQGNEFVQGSCYKNKKGEIFFGGFNGFSYFDPDSIKNKTINPPLLLTDLYFFDKKVIPGSSGSPLLNILNETPEIILSSSQATMFSIQFMALDYLSPCRIKYRYKLEGYDDRWIEAGKSKNITFTNLDAGSYIFNIVSTNSDGQWVNNEKLLVIKIMPPFYKSIWAKIIYVLLLLSFGFAYHKYYSKLIHLKTDLKLEKLQKEKAVELDRIKSDFFTNISHEFRTPLTLILVPLQGLIENSEKQIKQQLLLMQKSAKRLFRLVNQVIDFNQIETGELKINKRSIELIGFIRDIVESFIPLASNKHIHLHFKSDFQKFDVVVDPEMMDMVIFNLLSNALKFTPLNGDVTLFILKNSFENISIIVEDTGPGIPEEHLPHIFERFYHIDIDTLNKGTGIGLTLSKEIVDKHSGQLLAENKTSGGAKFTVLIPALNNNIVSDNESELLNIDKAILRDTVELDQSQSNVLLIIEDDLDLRECLRNELSNDYQIIEASNGEEGFHKAVEVIPDLIISDIMMIEMDGLELCSKLKGHELTSHIPIILLTARTTIIQQIEGLKSGADDYITKPFNMETLRIKLKNQLKTRIKFKEHFSTEIHLESKNIPVNDLDAEFVKRAINIAEDYLSDGTIDIDKFSKLMGVSRSQLLRKLKVLTNQTPQEFIRSIRLKQAARLLKESKLSITEICYKTGFNYPAHFTHHFKLKFGLLPKEFRKQNSV